MRLKQKVTMVEQPVVVTIVIDGGEIAGASIPSDLTLEEMRDALVKAIEGINVSIAERDAASAAADSQHDEDHEQTAA